MRTGLVAILRVLLVAAVVLCAPATTTHADFLLGTPAGDGEVELHYGHLHLHDEAEGGAGERGPAPDHVGDHTHEAPGLVPATPVVAARYPLALVTPASRVPATGLMSRIERPPRKSTQS